MTEPGTPNDETTDYEFRITGHLDEHWSTWFDGLSPSSTRTTAQQPCEAP